MSLELFEEEGKRNDCPKAKSECFGQKERGKDVSGKKNNCTTEFTLCWTNITYKIIPSQLLLSPTWKTNQRFM